MLRMSAYGALLLGVLMACDGGGTGLESVSEVVLTPGSGSVRVGLASVQFQAAALNGRGRQVTGVQFTWASSDPGVATIDDNGVALGISQGVTDIEASTSGVVGSATLSVLPAACGETAEIGPGEIVVSDPTSTDPGCGLRLTAAPQARYRVAVVRLDSAGSSSVTDITLRVEELLVAGPSSSSPSPRAPVSPQSGVRAGLAGSIRALEATSQAHERLRQREQRLIQRMGLRGLLRSRSREGVRATSPALARSAPDKQSFDPNASSCSDPRSEQTGILLGENAVLAIYQDSADASSSRIKDTHVQMMLDYFGTYGRQTVEEYFGAIPDVDQNGQVLAFVTSDPFGDDGDFEENVIAYVWAGNYFDRDVCPASDEAEVLYFNPERIESIDDDEFIALGVLSHESTHLVSLFHRLARTNRLGSPSFLGHPTWMEEGRAELADEVTSRRAWFAVGGPSPTERLDSADFRTSGLDAKGECCRAEVFGVLLQMFRTVNYLGSQPNSLVVTPVGARDGSTIRDSGSHFHRWLADAYGNAATGVGADAQLFRSLTDSLTQSGTQGLQDVVGKALPVLFEEFAGAIMLNVEDVLPSERSFTSYDYATATDIFVESFQPPGVYPWPVTTTGAGSQADISKPFETSQFKGPIGPLGMRIHDLVADDGDGDALLTVTMDTPVPLRLVVARLF